MGYACPVCDQPQRDGEHLANHLAFTAMLSEDGHEAWLDEHAPGWAEQGPEQLGPRVAEFAPETEYEEVFEDTVHDHATDPGREAAPVEREGVAPDGDGDLDPEARRILREARELTERMLDGEGE